jgi:hypothetical protein
MGLIRKKPPTSPTVTHIFLSLYKFNKRPSAMTGSRTPNHIPALGATGILLGLQSTEEEVRMQKQCSYQIVLRLFYNTH